MTDENLDYNTIYILFGGFEEMSCDCPHGDFKNYNDIIDEILKTCDVENEKDHTNIIHKCESILNEIHEKSNIIDSCAKQIYNPTILTLYDYRFTIYAIHVPKNNKYKIINAEECLCYSKPYYVKINREKSFNISDYLKH